MERIVEQYNAANMKLQQVRTQIARNKRLLDISRYNLMVANQNLKDRAVALYKQQPVDLLDVVLSTSSFEELSVQLDLMQKLGEHDVDVMKAVAACKRQITKSRNGLLADRAQVTALLGQISRKKATIDGALARRRRMLRGIEAEVRRLEAAEAEAARRAAQAAAAITDTTHYPTIHQRPIIPDAGGPGHPKCAIAARYPASRTATAAPALHRVRPLRLCHVRLRADRDLAAALLGLATADGQAGVHQSALLPGDLVFRGYPAYHVGIYVGGGTVIHSPHTGAVAPTSRSPAGPAPSGCRARRSTATQAGATPPRLTL